MARIPEAEIERLKNEVAVERLVGSAGIDLKHAGKDLLGRCPFHDDREASLVVTPAKNLWHCFSCQVGGGPIDWVMKKEGVSFRHAIELLREGISSLAADGLARKRGTVRALPAPMVLEADDQQLLNDTITYYHERLKGTPEALSYLMARGIDHPEVIERFKLGFADRTLGLRLPEKNRKAGAEIRARLQKIGLLRESGHEHFNGSMVIPVLDESGNVAEVYGRKVRDDLRLGTPSHLYLPGPHRGVWNVEALQASKEIILCEALIDALTFWCAGYCNVTASYGIEGFNEDHLAAFKRYGTERVLIAYDCDDAGEKATQRLAEKLMTEGIECFRIQFPKGMDANEYACKVTPAGKSLGLLIRKAMWLGKGTPPSEPPQAEPMTNVVHENGPFLAAKEVLPAVAQNAPPAAVAVSPTPILLASPLPSAPADETPCEVKDNEVVLTFADRRYRIRGLAKNLSFDLLKVNVMVSRSDDHAHLHVDTLDFYSAKARASYITQAAIELGLDQVVLKTDLGRVLLKLEALQEEAINAALKPKEPAHLEMTPAEHEAALALLRGANLMDRIVADFDECGLVGERTNKLVGYLASVSRKLDRPLGVVIQSSSAAGKTTLLDAVLAFVPEEERVKYSAMTGQSLFYMGETNLKHKALAIVEEEGASRASYALKLLQSEGELTIASTGKDPTTGNLITQQYRVEGPVALLLTTTARDLDEELLNRCLVLSVDESREQTQAIHQVQREQRTLEGIVAKRERAATRVLHQNAQRLLRPLEVWNPYVRYLTFSTQTTRLRRDHEKYLTLIDAIALLHQHQREVRIAHRGEEAIECIEVTFDDIALANNIAHEVLGRSLDELPPQTRRLLRLMDGYVTRESQKLAITRTAIRFSRRVLREAITWGDTQLKIHLARLVEVEYVVARRATHGAFDYELVYEIAADDESVRCPGLIDVDALKCIYDSKRSGQSAERSASGRSPVGGQSGAGRGPESALSTDALNTFEPLPAASAKTHLQKQNGKDRSYPQTALP